MKYYLYRLRDGKQVLCESNPFMVKVNVVLFWLLFGMTITRTLSLYYLFYKSLEVSEDGSYNIVGRLKIKGKDAAMPI